MRNWRKDKNLYDADMLLVAASSSLSDNNLWNAPMLESIDNFLRKIGIPRVGGRQHFHKTSKIGGFRNLKDICGMVLVHQGYS